MSNNDPKCFELNVPTMLEVCKEYRAQLSEAQTCLKEAIDLVMRRVILTADELAQVSRWRKIAGFRDSRDQIAEMTKKETQSDVRWLSWCNQRAGNDGRRPIGVQWQRTKLNHTVREMVSSPFAGARCYP